jgi:DnaJ-class molecular chaperone
MTKFATHYDNLKVSRTAPTSVIKAAYKALCQCYHPDRYAGQPEQAQQIMKLINKAYVILSDPAKRAEHDKWIANMEQSSSAISPSEFSRLMPENIKADHLSCLKNSYSSSKNDGSEFAQKYRSVTINSHKTWIA